MRKIIVANFLGSDAQSARRVNMGHGLPISYLRNAAEGDDWASKKSLSARVVLIRYSTAVIAVSAYDYILPNPVGKGGGL